MTATLPPITFPRVMQRLAPAGGPLVGRAGEMDVLRRAWEAAAGGSGGVIVLSGEQGMGKTRLAAELAGEVDAAGGCVLVGSCPAHGADPYHPLVEALGALPAGGRDRDSMFDALAAGLAARARRAPVLLVLDDLHHADRSTLLAVRRIVDVAPGVPLLVVATYRDATIDRSHPLAELLAAVLPRPTVKSIRVEGVSAEAVTEMVGDTELGRRLWRQSAGNPVWLAELLRPGALDGPVAVGFDELVARRVARLTPLARALLAAAAVAGSEFGVDVVATAAHVAAGKVSTTLKQVVTTGFVVDEPGGRGDARRFVHEMVREAVERGLAPAVRVQLHLRIGRALERQATAVVVPAALAWHFRAAAPVGISLSAMRYSAAAGDRSVELLAWDEAAVHYGHALAAAAGAPPDARADLLLSLGEAQRAAGGGARARQAFLEAAVMARSRGDGPRMARAALALGQVGAVWGADPELEAVADEARTLLGRTRQPMHAPRTSTLPAADDFASDWLYDVLDGVPHVEEPKAAAPSRPVCERTDAAVLLRARHVALAGPEHSADRLDAADETIALAREIDDLALEASGNGWRLLDALELGRFDLAQDAQAAHADLSGRIGGLGPATDAAAWTAMRAILEGRVDDARATSQVAFDIAVEAGDLEAEASLLLRRWSLALEWGSSAELSEVAEECRALASKGPDGRMWRAALAVVLARSGRFDVADEELRRVTDHGLGELVRDPGRLHPLMCIAEVAWMLGDAYRAASAGGLLTPFADRVVLVGRGTLCRGSVARACGMVAASADRWDEAERHYRAALATHRIMGALPLLARTRYEWSTMLRQRGRKTDRHRAADSQRKAVELATDLGMTRLLEEIAGSAA